MRNKIEFDDDDNDNIVEIKDENLKKQKRNYRERILETPSHVPGLDRSIEEKITKKRKEQHSGITSHYHHHKYSDTPVRDIKGIAADASEWSEPERLSTIRTANDSKRRVEIESTPSQWRIGSSIRETKGSEWERPTPLRRKEDNTWEELTNKDKSYNLKNDEFDRDFYFVYIKYI